MLVHTRGISRQKVRDRPLRIDIYGRELIGSLIDCGVTITSVLGYCFIKQGWYLWYNIDFLPSAERGID